MKQKFKVGDKVTPTDENDYFFCKTGLIEEIKSFNGGIKVNYNDPSLKYDIGFYNPTGLKFSNGKIKTPSITISILPVKRKGETFYRYQLKSKNGEILNDYYSSKAAAKRGAKKFIKGIQDNNFEIV